ncbi:rubrerythrin [Allobaculum mucilyticum]|uniref:rubrerythrin n=1 Tax=Allobaculum mucilyticum TaxID=2834459 RepID=UPI001E4DC230|nr:rubrerythrin family protein [Allobaculum mucilyticum]UNT95249.1 rubrerythrin family protein [Allobaculum mucilyticum]
MELKDSQTWKNLETALAGESQAYTKYQWFAAQAKKDGYNYISNIFTETAGNEKAHAKLWFKYLNDGGVPDTMKCLQMAWDGEDYETTTMYADFAKVAREEGFTEIAKKMELVGEIESHHRDRYADMMNLVSNNLMFEKPEEVTWICLNCGYMTKAKAAPKICPVCKHPQAWFETVVDYNQNLANPSNN